MQSKYLYLLRFILLLSDLLLMNACLYISYKCFHLTNNNPDLLMHLICYVNLIWITVTTLFSLYEEKTIIRIRKIYRATIKSLVLHGVLLMICILMTGLDQPRNLFILFFGINIAGFLISRSIGTGLESFLKNKFNKRKSVAVLDLNRSGVKVAAYLDEDDAYDFVGFLGNGKLSIDPKGELVQDLGNRFEEAAKSNINEVYVSLNPQTLPGVGTLIKQAEKHCVRLKFVPEMGDFTQSVTLAPMGDIQILNIKSEPLEDIGSRFKKRLFDIIFSVFVITFVLSWLYPVLAILIKIQSPGPVLFKQLRSGRDNQPFWCYKFRSMKVANNDPTVQAKKGDQRITPIGSFMRRTSLDELPQFFNVLHGDMSVVGPRPHMVEHTELYSPIIDRYLVRQFLKPGITGWAQVNGLRGETKDPDLMKARVEHDIWYMEKWTLILDIRIVILTAVNVLKGEDNAY